MSHLRIVAGIDNPYTSPNRPHSRQQSASSERSQQAPMEPRNRK